MTTEEETCLLNRIWYKRKMVKNAWSEVTKFPHIFLTNAPLTFGHSQLVIPARAGSAVNETTLFRLAADLIEDVLRVFKEAFGNKTLHTKASYKKLAEATYSYGKYIKTLILRTSADENPESKMKIHLVPYFESSQAECHKRFHLLHKVPPDQKGGMIGWLGERETVVDEWLIDDFRGISLDEIGRDVWKLPQLAKRLNQALDSLTLKALKATR